MTMLLARVVRGSTGAIQQLEPLSAEFASMNALRRATRNSPEGFVVDEEYTLIERKPIIKFTVKRTTVIEDGEML